MTERNADFDVIIVGSGPAGLFTALELANLCPDKKVIILERGPYRPPQKPRDSKTKTQGFGGAGAFSDGKLELSNRVGGQLQKFLTEEEFSELMRKVDSIYTKFGGERKIVDPTLSRYKSFVENLKDQLFGVGLDIVPVPTRHFGTDGSYTIVEEIRKYLDSKNTKILVNTKVDKIDPENGIFKVYTNQGEFTAKSVVVAPGRAGAEEWFISEIKRLNIPFKIGGVDVGLRVETRASALKKITDIFHEMKIYYESKVTQDKVRTFCMCPYGFVTMEESHGLTIVNGHSYKMKKSENTNFAILVTHHFTEPFNDPMAYGRNIVEGINQLAGGGVLVQRLGDLRSGHRSHPEDVPNWKVQPTLKEAQPGDISLGPIPPRIFNAILEMLGAFGQVEITRAVNNDHTLLYAPEVKFYSVEIEVRKGFETSINNFYVGGDGSGRTRGLLQSSMTGIIIARDIASKGGVLPSNGG